MTCAPGNSCCAACQSMGAVAAWLDPRAVLSAYDTATQALEAARAQRARMNADDLRYLKDLEFAWDAMPPRAVVAVPAADEDTKSAAVANALQIATYLRDLTARVIARSGGVAPGGALVPVGPATDSGWSLPDLPDLPKLPAFPGLGLPGWLLVALGLGFLFGGEHR